MFTTQVVSIDSNGMICAVTEIESPTEDSAVSTARQWLDGQVPWRYTRREARAFTGLGSPIFAASAWYPGVHHA